MPGLLDDRQEWGGGLLGNPVVYRGAIIPRVKTADGETGWGWPQMALDAYQAMKAPGDVWQGKLDPRSQEGQERAMNLAGLLTLGSGAIPKAAGSLNMGIGKPIKAFHGSPHDFDKFDLSKIGTGEGAQAYGHGLYFAENEATAKAYREGLSYTQVAINGTPYEALLSKGSPSPENYAANAWWRFKNIPEAVEFLSQPGNISAEKAAARILKNAKSIDDVPGRMYEVNLHADPNKFLDWDKPLSGQPMAQQSLEPLTSGLKWDAPVGDSKFTLKTPEGKTVLWRDAREGGGGDPREFVGNMPGSTIYSTLPTASSKLGASETLNQLGIPGIKYLDQGSRGTTGGELIDVFKGPEGWKSKIRVDNRGGVGFMDPGTVFTTSMPFKTEQEARAWAQSKISSGTSNYVVFDPKIIEIVRKYGLGALGLTGLLGAQEDQGQ